jgi:8-oxo-dGTP pyrophosphatase MutT (NUDIX family)
MIPLAPDTPATPVKTRVCTGCMPYRKEGSTLYFLMVRNSKDSYWTFPKGRIEAKLTATENALKETYEEAGVVGEVGVRLGQFSYLSDPSVLTDVTYYAMRVLVEAHSYPEANTRKRQWFTLEQTLQRIAYPELGEYLHTICQQVSPAEFKL